MVTSMQGKYITIMDLEMATWPHAMRLGWPNPKRPPEIVQIGAVLVNRHTLEQVGPAFDCLIKPQINPKLSAYFIRLTGIGQSHMQRALSLRQAVSRLMLFSRRSPIISYGSDLKVLQYDLDLKGLSQCLHLQEGGNLRPWMQQFFPGKKIPNSGHLAENFGLPMPTGQAHNASYDCLSILKSVQHLVKEKKNDNPFIGDSLSNMLNQKSPTFSKKLGI